MSRPGPAPAPARTLADALRSWDDDALAGLLALRPDLARPAPADLGQLAVRAAGRGSVTMAIDRLDTAHVTVVEALALLAEPIQLSRVREIVCATPQTVSAVLGRLRALALVWGDDDDLRLLRAVHDAVGPNPAGLGPPLVTLLTATPPARVHALAADLGLAPAGDPVSLAAAIAAVVSDQQRLAELVDEASASGGAEARQLLDRLAAGPPTERVGTAPTEVRVATATTGIEHLMARGLLVALDARTVALPREVGLRLRGGRTTTRPVDVPPAPAGREVSSSVTDRVGAGAAFEAVRRMELLLETWGTDPPAVLRSGGLGVRDVRAAAVELHLSIQEASFLVEVARAAALLDSGDDPEIDEAWLPTDAFDDWREQPAARRWAWLVRAWLSTPRATVLVGGRDERDRPVNPLSPDLERGSAAAVRQATLRILAGAARTDGVDTAVAEDVDGIVAAVAWASPRRAGLRDRLVRHTLTEAHWLGVTGGGALTAAGRAILDDPERATALLSPLLPTPVDHVLVQADLTAIAPGPLVPAVASGLALLADVESRGGATVYRFSSHSVRRALDAGWPASQVHSFLAAHSRTPVPQPLTYLVDDTARRHGRLRVGAAGVYLRSDDEAELDTLLADASLEQLGLRRIAPIVALSDLPADVVLARLRRAHRAPLLESTDGRAVDARTDSRRARVRRPPAVDARGLDEPQVRAIVTAVRAGERARSKRPAGARRGGPTELVEQLRAAIDAGQTVWLVYLDETGTVSERVVDPLAVDGGRLSAYDHRSLRRRSFSLHRISRVAVTED